MTSTIQIDNQPFDPTIELFSFPLHHVIETMDELAKLRLLGRLKSAGFRGTQLDDRGLAYVAGVSTIDHLDLQETKISNHGIAVLARLPRLNYLRLKDNPQLTNDSIPHLLKLEDLIELQVHETSINQDGVNQLDTLHNLRNLCVDVSDGNYSFPALLELSARMPRCTILAKGRGEFCGGQFDGTWA